MTPADGPGSLALPVDGHVHFHSFDCAAHTLDAAAANFRHYGSRNAGLLGALLLTQARRERVFEFLRDRGSCGSWAMNAIPGEAESLLAQRKDQRILIVCGRQVRCASGLEVTALGTTLDFADGRPFEETIADVKSRGGLASLPWGFGKWLGARGRVVRASLKRHDPRSLAICDNGSRLEAFGPPRLIRQCRSSGYLVLPGTDPFPFGKDHRRTGSFGFLVPEPGTSEPWRDILSWLQSLDESPPVYGAASSPGRFLINNIGIQFYNRLLWARKK